MIMPRPLSGFQIKAEIKGFLLIYRLFQYKHFRPVYVLKTIFYLDSYLYHPNCILRIQSGEGLLLSTMNFKSMYTRAGFQFFFHNVLLHYQHHISKHWRPIFCLSYFWTFAQCVLDTIEEFFSNFPSNPGLLKRSYFKRSLADHPPI